MMKTILGSATCAAAAAVAISASASTAFAGSPLGTAVGTVVGSTVPIAGGGLLGLAAAGVVAGVWITRRRKKR